MWCCSMKSRYLTDRVKETQQSLSVGSNNWLLKLILYINMSQKHSAEGKDCFPRMVRIIRQNLFGWPMQVAPATLCYQVLLFHYQLNISSF